MSATSTEPKPQQHSDLGTPTVLYVREGYSTDGKRLLGRQAAGEGLLKGLAQFSKAPSLGCYSKDRKDFEDFAERVKAWSRGERGARWVPHGNLPALEEAGLLYRPDPMLAEAAWARRSRSLRGYSLCGVTHTIATRAVMQAFGDLLVAPVQPWDAVICTSRAVRVAVEGFVQAWGEYLAQRTGGRPPVLPQLPVIPLGVDCEAFVPRSQAEGRRHALRARLGIPPDDIALLFVGRLVFYAKAHPVPMYLAVERAARDSGRRLHLIQAGWFESPKEEEEFRATAPSFAPSANLLFVDGRDPEIRRDVWYAADLFVSLSDNVQETFGLTPVEAMAAGLPAVVSEWNGYRESVRHGVDGFLVPTLTPPPGNGLDLADAYAGDILNFPSYIGHVALSTAVDVPACSAAICALATQPELRARLGANGRERAREVYDWRVVVAQYEALWQDLAERRRRDSESAARASGQPAHPLCDDPYRVFGHYPTAYLESSTRVGAGDLASLEFLARLERTPSTAFGANRRSPPDVLQSVVTAVLEEGPLTVGSIVRRYAPRGREAVAHLQRGLLYLLKFDLLRMVR